MNQTSTALGILNVDPTYLPDHQGIRREVDSGGAPRRRPGRSAMPRGARHVETGILRVGRWGYELEMEGGGTWRLDVTRSMRRRIGQRVIVDGTRSGFDLLDVTKMRAADGFGVERSWWARLAQYFRR